MNITLDKQLKKLRKDKNITQESLANHLGITVQAVSKWERAEGMPDISLLPAIASFFNVTVDDLLGVGEIAKEKKIEEYSKKDAELFQQGKSKARVELLREAQKEFPNEHGILYDLMYALDAEDSNANADEIIELAERILDESTDNLLRSGAIQCLCFTYYYVKHDAETAKKYAKMGDHYSVTVNEMMPRLLEGDEAVEYCQGNIQQLVEMIHGNTSTLIWKGEYSPEETIKICNFVLSCYNLLYPDGNFGFYHCRISELYKNLARQYHATNNTFEMYNCLENAVEHCIKYDTRQDGMYTAFMVNKKKHLVDSAVKTYEENDSAMLLKVLERDPFAQYQDDDRMKAIKEKLKKVAVFAE